MPKTKISKTQKGLTYGKPVDKSKKIRIVPIPQPPLTIDDAFLRIITELHEIHKTLTQCKGILSEIRNQRSNK